MGGAITTAAAVLEPMAARGSGTFLITGGMVEPDPEYLSLSFGAVVGAVAPGTAYDADDIATRYWELHRQARPDWQTHVTHG